jgi:hypothetical protein
MKIPFLNIFNNASKKIPSEVIKQLEKSFPNAKNVDWEIKNEMFEAIFYLEDIEHIAKISKKGELIEYKKNLWPEELPEAVKIGGSSFGEIMNSIAIYNGDEVFYELIVRNKKLDRFEYIFNSLGVVLKTQEL